MKSGSDEKKAARQRGERSASRSKDGKAEPATRKQRPAESSKENGKSAPAEEAGKSGRLGLLKARHDAIKREIDQIREDLESEEEE